ncbi:lysine--tRNA ligase [Candidatus Vampirococcus lugosii]|uniref:Lysine--tRNA ligase n=1 Tax=Candidatus Vampirococcus lugosii TaxID=2789015 RepID=A0ABS5QJI4_9BACT|nr:lysine--tRNA ligase 1 [Candidatus Vampirococcus lugosii]
MNYTNESLDRIQKIKKLKDAGLIVYANKFDKKYDISEILKNKDKIKDASYLMKDGASGDFKTAGRIISFHSHGKLAFAKIQDNTGFIQICFVKDKIKLNDGQNFLDSIDIQGEKKIAYKIIEKFIDVGDYLGIEGDLFFTKHGELTIFVDNFQILSKAIRPLPEKWHGIKDKELSYRQRYLDLISNEETYNRFLLRSKFLKVLRDFYHENNFIEIETPVLGSAASGAAAKPFVTYHNDFDHDFFLRISPETNLKKSTVGRFEKVFEIARDFRNEGSDPSHLQEFTMVEHYAVYWNFENNMDFTEKMFNYLFDNIPELKKQIKVKNKNGEIKEIDFSNKWEKIDYIDGVKNSCGIDVTKYNLGDEKKLISDIKGVGVEFVGMDKMAVPTLIDYLYKKVLRPNIVGPAFVYNYPKTMQPLARQSDKNSNIVEQFQLVVNGWEIVKAYSELVDPEIQKANFDSQKEAIKQGDEEATSGDDDFVLAMEYAMPPQSGFGMGIERILTILSEQENLRDIVLFPLMKPLKNDIDIDQENELI